MPARADGPLGGARALGGRGWARAVGNWERNARAAELVVAPPRITTRVVPFSGVRPLLTGVAAVNAG